MIIKTFSATMAKQREELSARIMEYVHANKDRAFSLDARLTSDASFHCLTITLFGKLSNELGGTIDGYRSLKIFSATKANDRDTLGSRVGEIDDDSRVIVTQSSDEEFHCLVYIVMEN